jgi:hypothetical protein
MKRAMSWALLVAGNALAVSAAPAIPAAAATSGSETLSGTIVFAATGATTRTVIGSAVRARGPFKSVGRVVEVMFGDPVSQDDLVFPSGTIHVVSTLGSLSSSSSINPHSCLFSGTQQLTWQVTGGTGQFADATAALPARSAPGRIWSATSTAAARSCKCRATRWTSPRRAGRCRS